MSLYPCAQTGTPVRECRGGGGRFRKPRCGVQMTRVRRQTGSLGGNDGRCVRERASPAPCAPICAHDCVCVYRAFMPNLFCVRLAQLRRGSTLICAESTCQEMQLCAFFCLICSRCQDVFFKMEVTVRRMDPVHPSMW